MQLDRSSLLGPHFDNLPAFSSISFEEVKEQYGIKNGDWVVAPKSTSGHNFFSIYTPNATKENVYDIRHVGFSLESDSYFCFGKTKAEVIDSKDTVLKEYFNNQIINLIKENGEKGLKRFAFASNNCRSIHNKVISPKHH